MKPAADLARELRDRLGAHVCPDGVGCPESLKTIAAFLDEVREEARREEREACAKWLRDVADSNDDETWTAGELRDVAGNMLARGQTEHGP